MLNIKKSENLQTKIAKLFNNFFQTFLYGNNLLRQRLEMTKHLAGPSGHRFHQCLSLLHLTHLQGKLDTVRSKWDQFHHRATRSWILMEVQDNIQL